MPNGGNFDGDLGSLAALGAVEALAAANLRTRHGLEMVVWSAEESATFIGLNGSRIVAGDVKPSDMDAVSNGMTRNEAIRKIGGDPSRIMEAVRPRGAHHCYLELHIEQGGTRGATEITLRPKSSLRGTACPGCGQLDGLRGATSPRRDEVLAIP